MMQQFQTLPFSFFDSKGVPLTNYSVGDVIVESLPIPEGHTGIIKDNDTIFTTSGGSLDYVLKRASGKESTFRQGVSTDDSGFVNKLLKEGDRILIKLAGLGTGILDIVWDGDLKQVRKITKTNIFDDFDEDEL